ncbi:MAG: UDP-N-acetylmuramate dehydrogenase [Burkholderiales bacterium]|jgi:UDP-N-acetylmuramate dehydrogenase|nr:UDP-N-acetylmuramate dehydrogenase [Burkholderiales bacterium]
MFAVQSNYPLDKLNTLHLKSIAKKYFALTDIADLPQITAEAKESPIFVLGGGSNIILPEVYQGLIIHNQLRGITLIETTDEFVLVKAMAGEVWDDFVGYTIAKGWFGLENLSLIPGTIGASPIQNIGAYGVEVKDFIESVEVYDSKNKQFSQLNNSDCQFKYRDSYLKHNLHLIVTSVTFRLLRMAKLNTNYVDVAKALAELTNPTAQDLRNCVIKIRQTKLPDPAVIGNVGSFFHNPILDMALVGQLQEKYPTIPVYPVNDEKAKVSAGWLIDNLSLKGYRQGNVGVYDKQALVLVNHGNATAPELLALASYIQDKVWTNYAIRLNIEPLIVPEKHKNYEK